ncbi:MAG: hypothetical protein ACRDBQ_18120 [Shewanella sp.]
MQILINALDSCEFERFLERFDFIEMIESEIYGVLYPRPKVARYLVDRANYWTERDLGRTFDEVICVFISEKGIVTMFDQSTMPQRESLSLRDAFVARKETLMSAGIITLERIQVDNVLMSPENLRFGQQRSYREAFTEFYKEQPEVIDELIESLNGKLLDMAEEASAWVAEELERRVKLLVAFVKGEKDADVYDDCY